MSNLWVRKILLILLLVIPGFSGITFFAHAQVAADTTHVVVRQPGSQFVEGYKLQKEFTYAPPPVKTNFLEQLFDYLRNKYKSFNDFVAKMPLFLKILFWCSVLFCLYIIITKTKLYRIFYSDKPTVAPEYNFAPSDDQPVDFDAEINKQVELQQYRLAVRLLFLKVIYVLRNKELIRYSKDKTNFDYYRDLANNELKSGFLSVAQIFNHVWYGDVEIGQEQYLQFEKSFQTFYRAIDVQE
jgi:hypothetical protein